eukprot:g15083.t1
MERSTAGEATADKCYLIPLIRVSNALRKQQSEDKTIVVDNLEGVWCREFYQILNTSRKGLREHRQARERGRNPSISTSSQPMERSTAGEATADKCYLIPLIRVSNALRKVNQPSATVSHFLFLLCFPPPFPILHL